MFTSTIRPFILLFLLAASIPPAIPETAIPMSGTTKGPGIIIYFKMIERILFLQKTILYVHLGL